MQRAGGDAIGGDRGRRAEERALRHLEGHGLVLRHRNHRCRRGEVDLIMDDGGTLVFIEVRYRSTDGFGSAIESVTAAKRTRIITAARHYLSHHPEQAARPSRFDVIAIDGDSQKVQWIRDAFPSD